MDNHARELAKNEQKSIDSTFRNGSITAIGVVVGFSLGFLSRWSALPGEWSPSDLVSVALITLGLALQVKSLADLLLISSLQLKKYNRSVRIFLTGLIFVSLGVIFAVFADILGFSGIVLEGRRDLDGPLMAQIPRLPLRNFII